MKFLKRKAHAVHRGNMLVQAGIALAIVLYLAPGTIDRYADWQQSKVWTSTASHLTFVAQASKRYIRDNRDTLLAQVVSGPVVITGATLRTQGYLPSGFSLVNDSGQAYQLAVAKDPGQSGQLVAFVLTTGGSEIPYKGLRQIASETQGMGGYVWPVNTVSGADGGWQAKLGDYGLSGQQGRLAAFLSADALGTDVEGSDRLYRYEVNGRPDLNRMHTAIDMNDNNINNGGAVNAKTGTFTGQVRSDGRLSTGENLQLDGINTADAACSPNGQVSRNSSGAILNCVDGVWKAPGITQTTIVYGATKCDNVHGSSLANCPTGYRMLSGGFQMTSWNSNDAHSNAPDSSYPYGNGWTVRPPGDFGGCLRAVAYCGR